MILLSVFGTLSATHENVLSFALRPSSCPCNFIRSVLCFFYISLSFFCLFCGRGDSSNISLQMFVQNTLANEQGVLRRKGKLFVNIFWTLKRSWGLVCPYVMFCRVHVKWWWWCSLSSSKLRRILDIFPKYCPGKINMESFFSQNFIAGRLSKQIVREHQIKPVTMWCNVLWEHV